MSVTAPEPRPRGLNETRGAEYERRLKEISELKTPFPWLGLIILLFALGLVVVQTWVVIHFVMKFW